jgi:hypothetical protein
MWVVIIDGFGLVITFMEHLCTQLVTTICRSLLHTLMSPVIIFTSLLVTASNSGFSPFVCVPERCRALTTARLSTDELYICRSYNISAETLQKRRFLISFPAFAAVEICLFIKLLLSNCCRLFVSFLVVT